MTPWLGVVVLLSLAFAGTSHAQAEPDTAIIIDGKGPGRPPTTPPPAWSALKVRRGFTIEQYAAVPYARALVTVKVNGATITYTGSRRGWGGEKSAVWAVVDTNSDGKVEHVTKLLDDIDTPCGVALKGSSLFVSGFIGSGNEADVDNPNPLKGMLWRLDDIHTYALANKAYDKTPVVVTDKLPGDYWHGWRYMKFDEAGRLLVGIGAPCNVCNITLSKGGFEFASIYALDVDAPELTWQRIATGLRNTVGFEHHPDTGDLFITDNGRDSMGPDVPDCELNRLPKGYDGIADFGFPHCINNGSGDPWNRALGAGELINDPDLNPGGLVRDCKAANILQPVQVQGPHVAPLGLKFYRWSDGANFPKSYDRVLFVVQRGSWDRPEKIGYRIQIVRFSRDFKPIAFNTFAWGWLLKPRTAAASSWGRPADIDLLPDGTLIVSDDTSGNIFRIKWVGLKKSTPGRH